MKKRLGIAVGVTAVALLAMVGVFAGIAAQDSGDDVGKRSFADRVASILGLDSETVEDAFTQAREEMHDEASEAYLAKLVEHGKLTQEEADAVSAWQDAKPDVEFNYEEVINGSKRGWHGKGHAPQVMLSAEKLDYLVEEGVLSQADADSLQAWYDGMPEAVTKLMPRRGGWGDGDRGRHGKRGHRWGKKWGDGDSDDYKDWGDDDSDV